MELITLKIKNFKGIKELSINPNTKNTNIKGKNGVGKTTVADAFNWLLFGKDTNNKSDFSIKPIGSKGLESYVEAEMVHNGSNFVLKKIHKENFTKKHGSTNSIFSGTTTERFIDNTPVLLKNYDKFLNDLIDENIFKLLTSPLYFNTQLKWEDRRKLMIEICGGVSNKNVLEKNIDKFKNIENLLTTKSIDSILADLKYKKKKLNDELRDIPTRIDEANNSLIEIKKEDKLNFTKEIKTEEIKELEDSKLEIYNEVALQKQLFYDQVTEIRNIIRDLEKTKNLKNKNLLIKQSLVSEIEQLTINGKAFRSQYDSNKVNIDKNEIIILENKDKMNLLKEKYKKIKSKKLILDDKLMSCDYCKQEFQPDKKDSIVKKLQQNFNDSIKDEINELNEQGKEFKKRNQEYTIFNTDLVKMNEGLKNEMTKIKNNINTIEVDIGKIDIINTDEYNDKIKKEEEKIKKLNEKAEEITADEQMKIINDSLVKDNELLQKVLDQEANIKFNNNIKKRITELLSKERELADKYNDIKSQIVLSEEFILSKVALSEEKLNENFKNVTFKLFNKQINEGIKETFTTLVNGVPFPDTNGAGKINAGIEIINKLSKHFDFKAPIFIDNRESVINLEETNSQIINLTVSNNDLEVNYE